jgi:uncharacterized protein YbjQ (UPF0145 family)
MAAVSSSIDAVPAQERRILEGGLPDSAERRLADLRGGGLTSSFFSAAGLAVGLAEGIEPVGQVLGASSCRLAVGVVRRTRGPAGRLPVGAPSWHEFDGPVRSWTTVRQRALARLLAQASTLGADLVLGVRARRNVRGGQPGLVEMVLTGTAVRVERREERPVRSPVAALTSPQEFCLLRRAGIGVVGIAGSFSSVHVSAGVTAAGAWRHGSTNQELADLTTGVYEARRLAVDRLRAEAKALGASGVIGVDIADSLGAHDGGRAGMTITVHALGSAITRRVGVPLTPRPVMGLGG